jgi:hypothetical protein
MSCLSYCPILYVRSPAAFLDDSIFSPPLLPRMLTKPRTMCGCQPTSVHDLGKRRALRALHMAITSAFLLVRSPLGLAATFLARLAFFAGLAFLAALRAPLGFAVSGAGLLSLSITFSLIEFLLDRVAVVTWITPVGRNKSADDCVDEANAR